MVKQKNGNKKKRESPVKAWCFTLNNPTITKEDLLQILSPHVYYAIIADEIGESGTPHLQGYLELNKKQRFTTTALLFAPHKPHLEQKSKKSLPCQAADYCKKDGKYVETGTPPKARKANSNRALATMCTSIQNGVPLEEAMLTDPATYVRNYRGLQDFQTRLIKVPNMRDMQCFFFYGPTGVGKSHYCYEKWPDLYRKAVGKSLWMDGYDAQKVVFFDEFVGQYPRSDMLMITDKYPTRVEIKGGFRQLSCDLMLFASNKHPATFYEHWVGNEEHLRAFARRFTKVFWWPNRRRDSLVVLENKQEVEEWFLDIDNTRKVFGD